MDGGRRHPQWIAADVAAVPPLTSEQRTKLAELHIACEGESASEPLSNNNIEGDAV